METQRIKPDMTKSATELLCEDLVMGEGPEVTGRGQTVVVHYTGWLDDGKEFDSSRKHGQPFSFPLAVGYVIPGWDRGVVGMRVGGRRRLTVPPHWLRCRRCRRGDTAQCHPRLRNRAAENQRLTSNPAIPIGIPTRISPRPVEKHRSATNNPVPFAVTGHVPGVHHVLEQYQGNRLGHARRLAG